MFPNRAGPAPFVCVLARFALIWRSRYRRRRALSLSRPGHPHLEARTVIVPHRVQTPSLQWRAVGVFSETNRNVPFFWRFDIIPGQRAILGTLRDCV